VPFILRGVNLLGIDSVTFSMAPRLGIWRRLATDSQMKTLASIAREIDLAGLLDAFATLAPATPAAASSSSVVARFATAPRGAGFNRYAFDAASSLSGVTLSGSMRTIR
jgi:hypothetical protein